MVTNAAFATIQLLLAIGIAWRPTVKFALAGRDESASFLAGRPFGKLPARLLWLVLWGSMAFFALQAESAAPQGLHDMLSSMASGEPGWVASIDHSAAALVAQHGQQASACFAIAFEVIAIGIFLPAPAARGAVILAIAAATVLWVSQDFGEIFTGSATDPDTGPLLVLLAVCFSWPARKSSSPESPEVYAVPAAAGVHGA